MGLTASLLFCKLSVELNWVVVRNLLRSSKKVHLWGLNCPNKILIFNYLPFKISILNFKNYFPNIPVIWIHSL